MKTPWLETERLILRPLNESVAEEIYNSWASDADVARYMYWRTHRSLNETKEWLKMELSRINSDTWYRWVFEENVSGSLIGTGAVYLDAGSQKYMIAYNIAKSEWGKGYTTEAMSEIIRWAVTELGVKQLTAEYATENVGSGKVLEKLGFNFVRNIKYTCSEGREVYDGIECAFTL